MNGNNRGTSLLELLFAIVIVSVGIVTLTLIFPKASKTITNNRQHYLAANFAAAKIQDVKQQPYSLVVVTPSATTLDYFGANASPLPAGGPGCDCSQLTQANWNDLATFPYGQPDLYSEDGVTYKRQVCINLVKRHLPPPALPPYWDAYCPNDPLDGTTDFGLKNILVHVTWTYASKNFSYDTQSMVAR